MIERLDRIDAETAYYNDHYKDAQLNIESDGDWMAQLAGFEFDANWLARINERIGLGSAWMHKHEYDLDPEVIDARKEFYEDVLNWGDSRHPLHASYESLKRLEPTTVPLATFIGTQRVLSSRNVDAAKIIRRDESVLKVGPRSMEERILAIEKIGLDPKRVLESSERIFRKSPKAIVSA